MNLAICITATGLVLSKKQPNSMISLESGSAIYSPTVVITGDIDACKKQLLEAIDSLFLTYSEKIQARGNDQLATSLTVKSKN